MKGVLSSFYKNQNTLVRLEFFKFNSFTKVKKLTYIGGKMQAIKIYSMRVAMLCRLYDLKLINEKEYTKIKNRLENDYKKRDRK